MVTKKAFHRSRAAFVCRGLRRLQPGLHRLNNTGDTLFIRGKSLSLRAAFVKNDAVKWNQNPGCLEWFLSFFAALLRSSGCESLHTIAVRFINPVKSTGCFAKTNRNKYGVVGMIGWLTKIRGKSRIGSIIEHILVEGGSPY